MRAVCGIPIWESPCHCNLTRWLLGLLPATVEATSRSISLVSPLMIPKSCPECLVSATRISVLQTIACAPRLVSVKSLLSTASGNLHLGLKSVVSSPVSIVISSPPLFD
ncbi:hypothetical protein F4774DRAFT_101691 [Daldinia eschscholtzii]|nr:hypothetical protein F4774DRAFT_101691 [Daldinia eschscholtzii]